MITIKKSFGNCLECPLYHEPSALLDSNCKRDFGKVDVIFVDEFIGPQEIKKEKPFQSAEGKEFKKVFNKLKFNKLNYILTNIILCSDSKREEGDEINTKALNTCKENVFNLISSCDPKLIVLLGMDAMKAFNLNDDDISQNVGNFFEWRGYDVFVTHSPKYVFKDKNRRSQEFEKDLEKAYMFYQSKVNNKTQNSSLSQVEKKEENKGIFRYKIPKKYYTNKYRLVDVQLLSKTNEILYIFRDDKNIKSTYKIPNKYIYYVPINSSVLLTKILPFDQLKAVSINYKDRYNLDNHSSYEGDVHPTAKHAMDYYFFNEEDCKRISSNIYFSDIEIDTQKIKTFPQPSEAKFPINLITSSYNGKTICYVIDNGSEKIKHHKNVELKIFRTEKEMLQEYIRDFRELDPDYNLGWNYINFDMQYVFNRLTNIGMDPNQLSKFGETFINPDKNNCIIVGCIVLDQLDLYKTFNQTKRPNYRLDTISNYELNTGKLEMSLPFHRMYYEKLNEMIEYNIKDTILTVGLEDKLKHVELLDELRIACNTSFHCAKSMFGQVDSLVVSFLRNQGFGSMNSIFGGKKKFKGAFVLPPIPGIYEDIADFDYEALYPSNIRTYNIGVETFVMKFKDKELGYDLVYNKENLPDKIQIVIDPTYKAQEKTISREELFRLINDKNLVYTINGCFFLNHSKGISKYSQLLEFILSKRKEYKNLMFEAEEKGDSQLAKYYNLRQLTYKVLANSVYGIISKEIFRFFSLDCAEAITLSGQEAIKTAIFEGDAHMHYLHTGKEKIFEPITKIEMYGDELLGREFPNIVTGDTDSIFICFQHFSNEIKNSDSEKLKLCDKIQIHLNKKILMDMTKLHNVSPEFNRLFLKNELIISRGLFLAKKRYSINVKLQEGVEVNKRVDMGIETKRSDFPEMTKEFLDKLLKMIMESEKVSIIKLMEFVNSKEREFIDLIKSGDRRIARPISFSKAEDQYKTRSQNIKALMAWNRIVYDAHTVGDKVVMFRILGIDRDKAPKDIILNFDKYEKKYEKVTAVAIPDDEEKLPDYFIIDTKENLRFSFIDRYNLMLEPLISIRNKKLKPETLTF